MQAAEEAVVIPKDPETGAAESSGFGPQNWPLLSDDESQDTENKDQQAGPGPPGQG